jgi:hypothetical protein
MERDDPLLFDLDDDDDFDWLVDVVVDDRFEVVDAFDWLAAGAAAGEDPLD